MKIIEEGFVFINFFNTKKTEGIFEIMFEGNKLINHKRIGEKLNLWDKKSIEKPLDTEQRNRSKSWECQNGSKFVAMLKDLISSDVPQREATKTSNK